MDDYAVVYQRELRKLSQKEVGTALTPGQQEAATKTMGDERLHTLYERYITLLGAHGQLDPKFVAYHNEAEQ
jgi:hypothetical protein